MSLRVAIEKERGKMADERAWKLTFLNELMETLGILPAMKDFYTLLDEQIKGRIIEAFCVVVEAVNDRDLAKPVAVTASLKAVIQTYNNIHVVEESLNRPASIEEGEDEWQQVVNLRKRKMDDVGEGEIGWSYENAGCLWTGRGLVFLHVDVWVESNNSNLLKVLAYTSDSQAKTGFKFGNTHKVNGFEIEAVLSQIWIKYIEPRLESWNNGHTLSLEPGDFD